MKGGEKESYETLSELLLVTLHKAINYKQNEDKNRLEGVSMPNFFLVV